MLLALTFRLKSSYAKAKWEGAMSNVKIFKVVKEIMYYIFTFPMDESSAHCHTLGPLLGGERKLSHMSLPLIHPT